MKKFWVIVGTALLCSIQTPAVKIAGLNSAAVGTRLTTDGYPVSTDNVWADKWDTNVTVKSASLDISSGLSVPGTPANNQYSAVGWNVPNQFFSLKVVLEDGCKFGNDIQLYYGGILRSATGPVAGETRVIVNQTEVPVRAYSITTNYQNFIDNLAGIVNGAKEVEIRFYASGASGTGGTYRIGEYYDGAYTNLGLYGTVIIDPNVFDPNVPMSKANYGWEDGVGGSLFATDYVYKSENTTEQVQSGSRAVKVTVKPIVQGANNKVYFAWVKGLQMAEKVTAKVWAYDDNGADYKRARLIADYVPSGNIGNVLGAVSGTGAYTTGIGWEQLEYTWKFVADGQRDGMLIGLQLSDNWTNVSEDFYFDTLEITYPAHAQVVLPPAYDPSSYTVHTYGWENFDPFAPNFRETVLLGTYGALQTGLEISQVRSGGKALWISDDSASDTPEGYVAWIRGLQPGDYINASCFAKSYAGQTSGGVRLWAHYTYDDANIRSYGGSAGGYDIYSNSDDWTELRKTWVFPSLTYTDSQGNPHPVTGMILKIRTYSNVGEGGFVDDLSIEVPQTATVLFPSPDGPAICVGGLPSQFDLDANCKVDLGDFVYFVQDWLKCNLQPAEDCGL
ncbi:MAG: hypothetical protein WHS88_10235 [Anaerohalosphaeraceae bacterium]